MGQNRCLFVFLYGQNIHGYSKRPCACRLVSSVKKKPTLKLKSKVENTPKLQKNWRNLRKKYFLLLRIGLYIYIIHKIIKPPSEKQFKTENQKINNTLAISVCVWYPTQYTQQIHGFKPVFSESFKCFVFSFINFTFPVILARGKEKQWGNQAKKNANQKAARKKTKEVTVKRHTRRKSNISVQFHNHLRQEN